MMTITTLLQLFSEATSTQSTIKRVYQSETVLRGMLKICIIKTSESECLG